VWGVWGCEGAWGGRGVSACVCMCVFVFV